MLALTAIQPKRFLIFNGDGVSGYHPLSRAGRHRHEAGVDALRARVDVGYGNTRVIEIGLCNGVVSHPELELHHRPCFRCDGFGPKFKASLVRSRSPD